jgi:NADPH:quinone reductase-like Zn-dependent oxidoreductase
MRAIVVPEYGPPEALALRELPDPVPGRGEVRVRVVAAGVQPVDCKVRSGYFATSGPEDAPLPLQLGNEFAGIVDAVGEDVAEVRIGDAVLGSRTMTCYAEFVVVPAGDLVAKPASMSWEEAAGLPGAGQAAHTALSELGAGPGDVVLIHGAAGAVGTIAVQLARAWGARRVIGTASEPNHEYLRSLGAEPVRYGPGLVERVRALEPAGVDVALDVAGSGEALHASVELAKDRSRVGTIVDFEPARHLGVRGIRSRRSTARLAELVDLHTRARLRLHVRAVYPLEDAAAAHRDVEGGHGRGKVVLRIGEEPL